MRMLVVLLVLAAPDRPASTSVLGSELAVCGTTPVTGWYRDGFCESGPEDTGTHVVCARVTSSFLEFSKARGNDLVTQRGSFPGLKDGDRWCLCVLRWKEALDAGVAPPVVLKATHAKAATVVPLETLKAHALP